MQLNQQNPIPAEEDLDLDDLLAEGLALREKAKQTSDAKQRLKQSGSRVSQETAADLERIRQWEREAGEWKPKALVAFFEKYKCDCGRQQTIFRQFMLREVRNGRDAQVRWSRAARADYDHLPKEIKVQKWVTPFCTECSAQEGFSFTELPVSTWES